MLKQIGNKVYRRFDKELLCIQPWGKNSFRVQATQRHELIEDEDISALLPLSGRYLHMIWDLPCTFPTDA